MAAKERRMPMQLFYTYILRRGLFFFFFNIRNKWRRTRVMIRTPFVNDSTRIRMRFTRIKRVFSSCFHSFFGSRHCIVFYFWRQLIWAPCFWLIYTPSASGFHQLSRSMIDLLHSTYHESPALYIMYCTVPDGTSVTVSVPVYLYSQFVWDLVFAIVLGWVGSIHF